MKPEFDGGPATGQNLTVPYLTEGPSRTQNLTYYPPLYCTVRKRLYTILWVKWTIDTDISVLESRLALGVL